MKNTQKRGFTLVELIVVIAIMAILAAVLVPTITGKVKESKLSGCKTELSNVCSAVANLMAEGIAGEHLDHELMAQYGYNTDDNFIACTTTSDYKIKYVRTDTEVTLTLCDSNGNPLTGDDSFERVLPIKAA